MPKILILDGDDSTKDVIAETRDINCHLMV